MYRVVKRDGKVVDFDLKKISEAITKAFDACKKEYHPEEEDKLIERVVRQVETGQKQFAPQLHVQSQQITACRNTLRSL